MDTNQENNALISARRPAVGDASCVFCAIVAGEASADIVREWPGVIAIRPLGPVTSGHLLVLPRAHVADVGTDPAVSAHTMAAAAELLSELPAANIITSKGEAATQTVWHAHLHLLPRERGDGLRLPWDPPPNLSSPGMSPALPGSPAPR